MLTFSDICMDKKRLSQNNIIFLEMVIVLEYGLKTIFSKRFKQHTFTLHSDIFGDMGNKRFFQSDLEKTWLFSKC